MKMAVLIQKQRRQVKQVKGPGQPLASLHVDLEQTHVWQCPCRQSLLRHPAGTTGRGGEEHQGNTAGIQQAVVVTEFIQGLPDVIDMHARMLAPGNRHHTMPGKMRATLMELSCSL